jgi:serine protease AprX
MPMKKFLIIFIVFAPLLCHAVNAQNESKHFIFFTDKNNSNYNINRPTEFLSNAAIERRNKAGIAIDSLDLPVNQNYIDSILSTGVQFHYSSKWLNGILIETTDSLALDKISNISFVKSQKTVGLRSLNQKLPMSSDHNLKFDYGFTQQQVEMANGTYLHERGFFGDGMKIAILDLGFLNFNRLSAFRNVFNSQQVIATHDFVNGGDSVYEAGTHGTMVASTIIGQEPGVYIGTAPNASLVLLRTENEYKEEILEEYNWVVGAEYADAIGCDLINSSLGYYTFDNPSQNHSYADLDGNTCIATIGANLAAQKGMLVCVSAGNEGESDWRHIGTPADAKGILTVGAVKSNRDPASFSSFGPAADGRIKPEVSILGKDAAIINTSGEIKNGSGTSFASPILCGLAACLWQKHPEKRASEIRDAIIKSASLYENPDDQRGYGIPNFGIADALLSDYKLLYDTSNQLILFPNPTSEFTRLIIKSDYPQAVHLKAYNIVGQPVFTKTVYTNEGVGFFTCEIPEMQVLTTGVYFLYSDANSKNEMIKFVR